MAQYTFGRGGTREPTQYLLNEEQAMFLATKSLQMDYPYNAKADGNWYAYAYAVTGAAPTGLLPVLSNGVYYAGDSSYTNEMNTASGGSATGTLTTMSLAESAS